MQGVISFLPIIELSLDSIVTSDLYGKCSGYHHSYVCQTNMQWSSNEIPFAILFSISFRLLVMSFEN